MSWKLCTATHHPVSSWDPWVLVFWSGYLAERGCSCLGYPPAVSACTSSCLPRYTVECPQAVLTGRMSQGSCLQLQGRVQYQKLHWQVKIHYFLSASNNWMHSLSWKGNTLYMGQTDNTFRKQLIKKNATMVPIGQAMTYVQEFT